MTSLALVLALGFCFRRARSWHRCSTVSDSTPPWPPPVDLEVSQRRIRISFAGRPNVGKSSLCNRLLASDRMIVSDVPGTPESVERDLDYESRERAHGVPTC